jgi:hypothetical protein
MHIHQTVNSKPLSSQSFKQKEAGSTEKVNMKVFPAAILW